MTTYTPFRNLDYTTKSSPNSTKTALLTGETFTGEWEQINTPSIFVSAETDKDGVLYIDFSNDGVNPVFSATFPYKTDRINPPHIFEVGGRWTRVRFENTSGEDQSKLFITTSYGTYSALTTPINKTVAETYDATIVRPTEYKYEVAMGKRQGRSTVGKFGYNKDVDSTQEEIIGSFGGAFDPSTNIMKTAQTFTITYNSTTDGATSTGATQLIISYLDENFELQDAFHVLGSTGSDVTSFTGLGVNRVVVYANGGDGYNNNDITLTATTDATIQAMIPATTSVTQQCLFHIPINHTLMLDYLRASALKISGGGGSPRVQFYGYSYSRFTDTVYRVIDLEIDTNVENNLEFKPTQPTTFSGREVVYLTADTDVNNTSVSARFSGILERNS